MITLMKAKHLKKEAAKDDIKVSIKIFEKYPYICIGKSVYKTFEGALHHVQFLQSQIVHEPVEEMAVAS